MGPTCFDALDRHVIGGHADRVAVRVPGRDWTCAQLLEEVAAFAGALRHCGVGAGDRVVVALPPSLEAVVAVLACARIGATHALAGGAGKVLVTVSTEPAALAGADAEVVLVKQVPGQEVELTDGRDYDWDVVMRAGRTDPAACVEGATVTPYDEQTRAWLEPLLAGETLDLSP
ncbi:MAG: AMP-binding protein [Nocardioides sp.]